MTWFREKMNTLRKGKRYLRNAQRVFKLRIYRTHAKQRLTKEELTQYLNRLREEFRRGYI